MPRAPTSAKDSSAVAQLPEPRAPIDQQAAAVDAQHPALDLVGRRGAARFVGSVIPNVRTPYRAPLAIAVRPQVAVKIS